MDNHTETRNKRTPVLLATALLFGALIALGLGLLTAGAPSAAAHPLGKPQPVKKEAPLASQVLNGFPLTITVEDSTQMDIRYRNPQENQFFDNDAEGVYMWVPVNGVTKVFGPAHVPAGREVNPYTFVSNTKTGTGTPSNPWLITTVLTVPGSTIRLVQRATYINGAEFVTLSFQVNQVGGTAPVNVTLFHAADLYTAGSDSGYGYYDPSTGGVGDYYTRTDNSILYQQFVPSAPASAYMESYYGTIWGAIGDTGGPGAGLDNTIISDTLHDSGAALQWNLTVPTVGNLTVGDTDLFSPHASLCGSFSDVPYGSFYYDYVYYLACHGIVSGYTDTTFRPNNTATRGQLSKIIVLGEGWALDTTGGPHFSDVPSSNSFYAYIETAYHHNVISGYGDGTFRWGANVTRGQTAKIIVNAKAWAIDTSGGPHFSDTPASDPFYTYIETAYHHNVISGYGDGTFRPGANVTRGQLSKIVYLAIQAP